MLSSERSQHEAQREQLIKVSQSISSLEGRLQEITVQLGRIDESNEFLLWIGAVSRIFDCFRINTPRCG